MHQTDMILWHMWQCPPSLIATQENIPYCQTINHDKKINATVFVGQRSVVKMSNSQRKCESGRWNVKCNYVSVFLFLLQLWGRRSRTLQWPLGSCVFRRLSVSPSSVHPSVFCPSLLCLSMPPLIVRSFVICPLNYLHFLWLDMDFDETW